jgi:hypothetical protein
VNNQINLKIKGNDIMREIIKNVYTFEELSPEAQEKVIQDYIEGIDWDIESNYISECFKEDLKALGLPYEDVEWSLNSCQGDGVAFYGRIISCDDICKLAKTLLSESDSDFLIEMLDEIELEFNIVRNSFGHRYSHYNTMEVEMELVEQSYRLSFDKYFDDEEGIDKELSKRVVEVAKDLHESLQGYVKEISRKLEREGYSMIKEIQSEESAREFLENQNDKYYENGERFVG